MLLSWVLHKLELFIIFEKEMLQQLLPLTSLLTIPK